jgi:hypothetical protein
MFLLSNGNNEITFYRLAQLLGMKHRGSVYRWKNGTRKPSAYHLSQIKLLLKMKLRYQIDVHRINRIDWGNNLIYWQGLPDPSPYLIPLSDKSLVKLQGEILKSKRPEAFE